MSRTASADAQLCRSLASGLFIRSFPVFVLYSSKAASIIDLNCKDDPSVWEDEDIGGIVSKDSSMMARVREGERIEGDAVKRVASRFQSESLSSAGTYVLTESTAHLTPDHV